MLLFKKEVKKVVLSVFFILLTASVLSAGSADQLFTSGRKAFSDHLWSAAVSSFSELIKNYPDDPRCDSAGYMQAVALLNDGRLSESLDLLVSFPDKYPDSAWNRRISYWEGLARYRMGDFSGSAAAFENQLEISGEKTFHDRSLMLLGACREKLGDTAGAEQCYLELANEGTDYDIRAAALMRTGQLRLVSGRPEKALDAFMDLAYSYPASSQAADIDYWTAESYRLMGKKQEALDYYRNFLETVYNSEYRSRALLSAAVLASELHLDSEALAYLDLRDSEFPEDIRKDRIQELKVRAVSNLRTGNVKQARDNYLELINSNTGIPEKQVAYFNVAQTWLGTDEEIKAADYLRKAINGPDKRISADAMYLCGITLLNNNQEGGYYSEGAELLERFAYSFTGDKRRENALKYAFRARMEINDTVKALEDISLLINDFPFSSSAVSYYLVRANLYSESLNEEAALSDYGKILEINPECDEAAEANARIGFIYAKRKEYGRAAEYFENAASLYGGISGGENARKNIYSAGIAYYNAGNNDKAVKTLKPLADLPPELSWTDKAAFYVAEACFKNSDYACAREYYSKITENPDRSSGSLIYKALSGTGWSWYSESRWLKAAESFAEAAAAAEDNTDKAEALYHEGLCLSLNSDWEKSAGIYTTALSLLDQSEKEQGKLREELLYQQAWSLMNMDDFEGAMKISGILEKQFPESGLPSDLLYRYAEKMFSSGNYISAADWYNKCLNKFPDTRNYKTILLRSALAEKESGNYTEAVEKYTLWLEKFSADPDAGTVIRSLAGILLEKGDPAAAAEAKKRLETYYKQGAFGNNRELLYPVEIAWARISGIPGESVQILEKIVSDKNAGSADKAEALLLLARKKLMDGNTEDAKNILEVIIRDVPGNTGANAQYYMGKCFEAENNPEKAAESYLSVSYLFPDQKDVVKKALYAAERIYRENGMDKDAVKVEKMLKDL